MSFIDILFTILIKPLELVFELIFAYGYRIINDPGLTIIITSIAFNLLVMPLYRRADVIQKQARDKENEMKPMVDHIKKYFKGDERMMILQTYYKQENYSPLSSMKSLISLILQVPFFIAAYQFLSHLSLLDGQPFGPIPDLLKPDALLTIGGVTINVLPIIMTVVNIVSSEIYTHGQPFKSKLVLYATALIFIVLLYNSPAGLVFYWTMNNVFSLVKNLITKLIEKKKSTADKKPKKVKPEVEYTVRKREKFTFFFSALYMSALTGLYIPSQVVGSDVESFTDLRHIVSPSSYVWYSLCMAFGFFFIWISVYFLLFSNKWKKIAAYSMFMVALASTVNYLFFGTEQGVLSSELRLDDDLRIGFYEAGINTCIVLLVMIAAYFIYKYIPKITAYVMLVCTLAVVGMSVVNVSRIDKEFNTYVGYSNIEAVPEIKISKHGKNVVVIMIDRALGSLVPHIMSEKPTLKEAFDGFTYYPNTVSFGCFTNLGTPSLYGGYEYNPEKLNARADEPLSKKHTEALLLMPRIFKEHGFSASVLEMPYVNYNGDLTVYKDYGIDAYQQAAIPCDKNDELVYMTDMARDRNFFCYSLFKTAPSLFQETFYDDGNYHSLDVIYNDQYKDAIVYPEHYDGKSVATGIDAKFLSNWYAFGQLSEITTISDGDENNFFAMNNRITHQPTLLQTPDYQPANHVDNTAYDAKQKVRAYGTDGMIDLTNHRRMAFYHANMAAYLQMNKWFKFLKENDCWDNTRIIVVSDHGRKTGLYGDTTIFGPDLDIEDLHCVLMVKDFNSHGKFATSEEFMTNADVPTIAMEGLIENPVNPATGNPVTNAEKFEGPVHITTSRMWDVRINGGNQYLPARWYSVTGNIFDKNNWKHLGYY